MNDQWDLDLLMQPPDFSTKAVLTIDALAPLSMVASMPGKHYGSQAGPTDEMLYGMLENALGWQIPGRRNDREEKQPRDQLLDMLQKWHATRPLASGSGYASVLQFHLRFGTVRQVPGLLRYDDLWSQHLKGNSFVTGSRDYDARAIPLIDARAGRRVRVEEKSGYRRDPAALTEFVDGDVIHIDVLRPYFPQYYISPTPREYVLPQGPYRFVAETSVTLAEWIGSAIRDPAAPLYLGTSDGWVEADWRVLS